MFYCDITDKTTLLIDAKGENGITLGSCLLGIDESITYEIYEILGEIFDWFPEKPESNSLERAKVKRHT